MKVNLDSGFRCCQNVLFSALKSVLIISVLLIVGIRALPRCHKKSTDSCPGKKTVNCYVLCSNLSFCVLTFRHCCRSVYESSRCFSYVISPADTGESHLVIEVTLWCRQRVIREGEFLPYCEFVIFFGICSSSISLLALLFCQTNSYRNLRGNPSERTHVSFC